jgi:hypothetical protein
VGEFVGDDVAGEGFGAIRQPGLEDDAAAAASDRTGDGHPERPTFAGDVIVNRDAEPRIIQEIALYQNREFVQDPQHALPQWFVIREGFQIGRKDEASPREVVYREM